MRLLRRRRLRVRRLLRLRHWRSGRRHRLLRGRRLNMRLLHRRRLRMRRLLRLRHRRPGLRWRLLRGGRRHVRRLLRLRHGGPRLLRRGRLHMGRLLRLRAWRVRGGRRRCFRLRLAWLLFLRLLRLLLREQHRAILTGARSQRLAERKSRDDRSGKQDLFRPRHLSLFLRVVWQTRVGRTGTTAGRQWCVLIMTK
jgi:hypothetical protein